MQTALEIVKYPAQILRAKAKPVTEFDYDLRQLAWQMMEMIQASGGVGMAAPQANHSLRMFLIASPKEQTEFKMMAIVNPEIVEQRYMKGFKSVEGCLSCPGAQVKVVRPVYMVLKFQDLYGEKRQRILQGTDAIIASHEIDHLQGILNIHRVSKKERIK